jgi:hypothetical protein
MEISPYLIVHKVVVHGFRKTYEATFKEGLNLIWGDMDSGKSSILNLIDYCFGGGNEKLLYGEMKAYGRIAFLEVDLNGKIYTFERDILSSDSYVRIYAASYEGRSSHFPLLVAASSTDKSAPDGWISDFILDCLGIPKVTIKESRNREDASSDRLSFRDLMKLLYLKQTRVGSDNLLNYQSPAVYNKNAEIQKFVFNIYDDRLASLEADLKEELAEANELERNERSIRKFLADVNIQPDNFNGEKEKLDQNEADLEALDDGLHQLKQDVLLANDIGRSLAEAIHALRREAKSVDERSQQLDFKYDNFAKLSNTYRFDIDALKLSKVSRTIVGVENPKDEHIPCALCQTPLKVSDPSIEDVDALMELRSQQRELLKQKDLIASNLQEATRSFDENSIESVSPLITAIQEVESSRTRLKIDLAQAERNVAIVNKFEEIGTKRDRKAGQISQLRRAIQIVKDGLVGLDEVIGELRTLLEAHLKNSGLLNVSEISIDKKFTSFFRGISYYNTSSGGVRTITSIASYVTRLQYLLTHACNLPTFLMIDTPGQNIGRYRASDDSAEVSNLSDPQLYEKIFTQIVAVLNSKAAIGRKCQVIIVDNDLPESLTEGENFHLVKRFSKKGGKFEKGLINDAEMS